MPTKKKNDHRRADGRKLDELRKICITPGVAPAATASVLMEAGRNKIICAVSIEEDVPRWMRAQKITGGWVTAEYSMLPYASEERKRRDITAGKIDGRSQEIQRLIGRSMRAVIDLEQLGPRTVWIDCDVVRADGGTRTASITGAFVACRLAVNRLIAEGRLAVNPIREALAAVSVGIVGGQPMLDLAYTEDVAAETDMNVVMTESGKFVELQGTAEEHPFSKLELSALLKLAEKGVAELLKKQRDAIRSAK